MLIQNPEKIKGRFLAVAQLGNDVLRKKSLDVEAVDMQLVADLIATCRDLDGVGIAAPQVYESVRLFILASHPNKRYPRAPLMKPAAVVNPSIIFKSTKLVKDWEGCLSVPGIRGLVPRHYSIEVEYENIFGKKIRKEFKGFVARIFQHEFDHIEGEVFLDRLESNKDIISEKEFNKLMKRKKD